MTNIKEKVIVELKRTDFPDLAFLFSKEVLNEAPEILKYFLEEEKQKFSELLKIKKEDIRYESFEHEDLLDYFWSLLNHYENVSNTKKIRKIIDDFRPILQDFCNMVAYSKKYFNMLIYCEESCELDSDQRRVMQLRIKDFKDRGIDLDKKKQDRIKELNKILAELQNKYSNNALDDKAKFEYIIEDFEIIKDLPFDVLEVALNNYLEKVKKTGKIGGEKKYLFTADHTGYAAIMKYCSDSNVRKYFEKTRNSFASEGTFDNRHIVLDILKYRKEKAELLGYKNYAELSLNDKMADSPKQVIDLIKGISKKARKKANEELEELKSYFSLDEIESYDLSYYSRKLKEEKYLVDDRELKKFFELGEVLKYLHNFVKNFYGLEMKEIKVSSYDSEVKTYEVYKNNKLISYYFLDYFYRKEKRSGAWFNDLREKTSPPTPLLQGEGSQGRIPIVVNVCNFQKSSKKILLTKLDVETIFHEFGHATHEMLSVSKLSELGGCYVEWDAIELPSQVLENWVKERDSLKKLAKHSETGEMISDELLNKLDNLKTFMEGCFVIRQNEFALLDMYLHSEEVPKNVKELDEKVNLITNKEGLFDKGEEYKMYTSFTHIFAGGYSAGYYSYLRAEIIEVDVFEKIKELGMFDRKVGEKFINTILGQGAKKPFSELFYDFMGRDLDDNAFLKRKGLI